MKKFVLGVIVGVMFVLVIQTSPPLQQYRESVGVWAVGVIDSAVEAVNNIVDSYAAERDKSEKGGPS